MRMNKTDSNYLLYSKPKYLMKWSQLLLYPSIIMLITFGIAGLYVGLIDIPSDYQQGENYRIMFIHVPFAWLCILDYLLMAILSFIYLIIKHPLLHISTNILSKLGILFTVLTLITGSLWGLPMWGTWWVWDARLTSVLILLFIYIGYLIVYYSFNNQKGPFFSSILCLVGFINIPIIKYSVDWWSTLHQPSSITKLGTSIHESMLYPLALIFISLILYSIVIFFIFLRYEIVKNKKSLYFMENN